MCYINRLIGICKKFFVNCFIAKMKTAVENNYAANYVKNGSKRLDFSRDIFLYSSMLVGNVYDLSEGSFLKELVDSFSVWFKKQVDFSRILPLPSSVGK